MKSKCRDIVFLGLGLGESDLPEAYVYLIDYYCALGFNPALIIDDVSKELEWLEIFQGIKALETELPVDMLLRLKRLFKAGQLTAIQIYDEVTQYRNQIKQNNVPKSEGNFDPN